MTSSSLYERDLASYAAELWHFAPRMYLEYPFHLWHFMGGSWSGGFETPPLSLYLPICGLVLAGTWLALSGHAGRVRGYAVAAVFSALLLPSQYLSGAMASLPPVVTLYMYVMSDAGYPALLYPMFFTAVHFVLIGVTIEIYLYAQRARERWVNAI